MASVINTNMASLYAQKNLSGAQNALSTSVERLSSGLRINRAKDDAAGLGISEKIKSQVTSLNQGLRNANDAISMVQTAEGSLSEVSSILQRMKELSVQARNDSLSTTQRSFISDELVALKNEINSIAERTTFNDLSLLKNALRTQVAVPTAGDTSKLVNGTALLDGISVSSLAVKNTNAGTYTVTTGTQTAIANQISEAAGKFGGAEVDTIELTGTYANTNVITATIAINGGATITASYTVDSANDLEVSGVAGATTVAGNSAQAYANIAKKLAAEINVQAQAAPGAPVITARANGAFIYIGGNNNSVTMTTTAAVSAGGTVSVGTSNLNQAARTITIAEDEGVEGNKFTLTIGAKEYSVVAGYGATAGDIAKAVAFDLRSKVLADYAGLTQPVTEFTASTKSFGTSFSTVAGNGLGTADISLKVTRLTEGNQVTNQMSSVSDASPNIAAAERIVRINDFDVVAGRKVTVKVGNPEISSEYSTIIDSNDNAGTIATRLRNQIAANFAGATLTPAATVETFAVTFATTPTSGGTITFDGAEITIAAGLANSDAVAQAFRTAYNAFTGRNYDITGNNSVLTFTQRAGSNVTDPVAADFVSTVAATTLSVAAPTVQGSAGSQIRFQTTDNLGMANIQVSYTEMVDGSVINPIGSKVSGKNHARSDRTITINQSDLTAGNVVSANIGQKEYAVKVESGETAASVAYRLSTLIDNDYGGVVTTPSITKTEGAGGTTELAALTFNSAGMRRGDSITIEGLTFTASRNLTQAEVAGAFANLASGNTTGNIDGRKYGVYSGTLGGAGVAGNPDGSWSSGSASSTGITFTSAIATTNVTDLVAYSRRAVSVGAAGSSHVITLGAGLELGLEDISVSVKKITDPGKITITANADTGIGGTKQSIDVGTIAAGSAKSFDFDNLGVSFTLNNTRGSAVNAASFEALTPKANTLAVQSAMNGEALFQVGAGTRDNVVLDGFKDIRITGQNKNAGSEKEVFDKINETLTTIAANTTESLSTANFATLENRIEDAITMVSDFRSYFGGQQNRIEFAISNIQAQSENLTAANSRIVDTDYAAETANLTKTQIMQQAATAMLAQANQMPNVILALLK